MSTVSITEASSSYQNLDQMEVRDLLTNINHEDQTVPVAVAKAIDQMILNMITTAAMVKLGKVKGNKMVDMQLSNDKLVDRGVRMVMEELQNIDYKTAKALLLKHGSVRKTVDDFRF